MILSPPLLTSIGLILNLGGVVILFVWGPLPGALKGVDAIYEPLNAEGEAKEKRHTGISVTGLVLVVLGTVFQVAGAFIAD